MSDLRLQPAQITALAGPGRVRLRLEGGAEVSAELALTFPYTPAVGDALLVISELGEHFAIGVLGAEAPRSLALGEVGEVLAGGPLVVHADESLTLDAPRVTIRGRALRTFASRLSETADHVDAWVRGLLTERAGEARRVVAGDDVTHAGRSVTLARDKVKLDADVLELGS